jgi:hypothetical protein
MEDVIIKTMDQKFITKKELESECQKLLDSAKTADLKWIYCYFSEFEEFPLVVEEPVPDQPGYKVWEGPTALAAAK